MASTFLKAFFAAATLPDEIVPLVLANYQDGYASSLAANPSLGDRAAALVSRKLDVDSMVILAKSANPVILDAILATRERRDAVIDAIVTHWRLCPTDQMRLADRPLSTNAADQIIRTWAYTPASQAVAALRSSEEPHARWVVDSGLDDEALFAHLLKADLQASILETYIPLLTLRPALRSRALHSDLRLLRQAACWTELDPADQEYAVAQVLEKSSWTDDTPPAVGLLGQPSLRLDLREALMDRLADLKLIPEAAHAGIRPVTSRLYTGVKIADLSDPDRIDDQLDLVSVPPSHRNAQMITGSVLIELSRSVHLSPAQLDRVAVALCQHVDEVLGYRRTALVHTLRDVAARLDPDVAPPRALARFEPPYSVARELPNLRDGQVPVESSVSVDQRERPYHYAPRDQEKDLEYSPANMEYQHARIERQGPAFVEALGDGTTEHSQHCWRAFLGLVVEDPDVPLKTVLTTARQLTRSS